MGGIGIRLKKPCNYINYSYGHIAIASNCMFALHRYCIIRIIGMLANYNYRTRRAEFSRDFSLLYYYGIL